MNSSRNHHGWKAFAVRTCLTVDFVGAVWMFFLLLWINPELYADTLAKSGETIRRKIAEYSE